MTPLSVAYRRPDMRRPVNLAKFHFAHRVGYALTTLIRPALRERGFGRITISTSRSSAVNRLISRSIEKLASL